MARSPKHQVSLCKVHNFHCPNSKTKFLTVLCVQSMEMVLAGCIKLTTTVKYEKKSFDSMTRLQYRRIIEEDQEGAFFILKFCLVPHVCAVVLCPSHQYTISNDSCHFSLYVFSNKLVQSLNMQLKLISQ